MQFLYPFLRQFPFDETSEKIVRALEERHWQVPGISVAFDDIGCACRCGCSHCSPEFRRVSEIKGDDFRLFFNRFQQRLQPGYWNDCGALLFANIQGAFLRIPDMDGFRHSCLSLYAGDNWASDRAAFVAESLFASDDLDKLPPACVYEGSWENSTVNVLPHQKGCPPYLVFQRGALRNGEPKFFRTATVMHRLDRHLKELLTRIQLVDLSY